MKDRVFFFDLARCVAAVAVIAIHVLAPYRNQLGDIPFDYWLTAVTVNSVSRWAVPVFILISGALMLSDSRPFELKYYLKRRLGKVFIPFVIWSLFYAYLSGWSATGFNGGLVIERLQEAGHHATYYHLGFFYYFIPLYFVMPIFQWCIKQCGDDWLFGFIVIWLITSTLFLLRIDGVWSYQMWLYSGFLPLGYTLYKKTPSNLMITLGFTLIGSVALAMTIYMVISMSLEAGKYSFGRWLSYKTVNTIMAASMVLMLCRYFGEGLSAVSRKVVGFISQHSLGIYLLHPIFLWPMKEFGWYTWHPALVIPLWVIISGGASLIMSWLLSKTTKTAWLLP